jgi:hypothetical protein
MNMGFYWGAALLIGFLCAVELAQCLLVPVDLTRWVLMP